MNILGLYITTKKKRLAELQEHRNEVCYALAIGADRGRERGIIEAREPIKVYMVRSKSIVEQAVAEIQERKARE